MPNILTILENPNNILRKISQEIDLKKVGLKSIKKLYLDMLKTLSIVEGAGLAAPQIGKNIRLAIINLNNRPRCLINPVIVKKSWAKEWVEEGCLSVPGIFGKVLRYKKLTCLYLDESGAQKKVAAEGLLAQAIQHEIDHLDGILFIDKAKDLKKQNETA